jgi:hypothetical protein
MSLLGREKESVWSEWELQSLLRYIQSMESKSYSNERIEARRIQGLIDDPHVSEAYRKTLRKHIQKKKSQEKLSPHFERVVDPILEFDNF